ncbi:hypothetical protein PV399_46320, partial [Streptomyces acidiscabies]|nr:hypothetical protein [Streptomyces acidiscabies]MDX3796909.1 hypothetical protein [Streptomyces acidiscabies]
MVRRPALCGPPSRRGHDVVELVQAHADHPRIFTLLVRWGWRISVNTVAKLMAELGLVARVVRRRSGRTRPGKRPAAPDSVRRDLVWEGDMTEIVTEKGKLHLATVIDLFSRRLLGY